MKRKKNPLDDFTRKAKALIHQDWYKVVQPKITCTDVDGDEISYPDYCLTTPEKFKEIVETHCKNRDVIKAHVRSMYNSFKKLKYVLRPIILVVFEGRYYIIDGQHLSAALIEKELPIYFYLVDISSETALIEIMREMNCTSKRWSLDQFIKVNSNVNLDKKVKNSYDYLIKFVEENQHKCGMTPRVMATMMYNPNEFKEGRAQSAVRGGYFVQNTPKKILNERLVLLNRFYRKTKMTPTNYLNNGIIKLMYDKLKLYNKNEKSFLISVSELAKKENKLNLKFGNTDDALRFVCDAWSKSVNG